MYERVRESFVGDQVRIARELRRLTQTELSIAISELSRGRSLTSAAISQFEKGLSIPSESTIASLASVLEVEPEFFTADAADQEVHLPAFFRSLRATPVKDRKRARNIAQLVHRLASVVGAHVEMPKRDIPSIPCDPFEDADERHRQAERAAGQVRRAWSLPRGPVQDVIRTMERHGVICARLRFNEERVDAFSVAFSDYPVAVLTSDKEKWDRSRFDAAHELGHVVMHGETAGAPEVERQANEFAAAFLMPASDIRGELPTRADWQQLLDLKETWGTSVASLLYRARTLKVMPEKTYVGASKVMAARGWKRHEPLSRPIESPHVLNRALSRAKTGGLPLDRLRREASIPADIFREICAGIAN